MAITSVDITYTWCDDHNFECVAYLQPQHFCVWKMSITECTCDKQSLNLVKTMLLQKKNLESR